MKLGDALPARRVPSCRSYLVVVSATGLTRSVRDLFLGLPQQIAGSDSMLKPATNGMGCLLVFVIDLDCEAFE